MNNNDYMQLAIEKAKKAIKVNEVPIASIIVDEIDNRILSLQHNETISSKNPLNHAEMLAIQEACQIKNSKFLSDSVIYTTLEPCMMCAAAISEARIKKIYFGAYDEKKGAIDNGIKIFNNQNYFKPEVYGGIHEKECSIILKNFFLQKR